MAAVTNECKKKLSIVVPAYNEESCLPELWRRFVELRERHEAYDFEFIFVDDGSVDGTLEFLRGLAKRDQSVKVLSFSRNFGHECAITAGCFYAKGDAVVLIDADLQDDPKLIDEMLKNFEEGHDVVYAVRRSREGETLFKRLTAKWFYGLLNWLSYVEIPSDTSNYRLISRRVLEVFNSMPERDRFIRGMIAWIGFRQTGVYFDRNPRYAGKTKYSLRRMLNFAIDGLVSFSNLPLRLSLWAGVSLFGISLFSLLYWFFFTDKQDPQLWIVSTVLFVGSIQLIALGIMGEYIARIHNESRRRPLYIIAEKLNLEG